MKIKDLFNGIEIIHERLLEETKDHEIQEVVYDSRKASDGKVFVALKGMDVDGHEYVEKAYALGCRHFVVEDDLSVPEDAYVYQVQNTREVLAHMAANFYGHPSKEMTIIGVTGTKGKTTVTHYMRDLLEGLGVFTGLIGTVGMFYGHQKEDTINTTPESLTVQRVLRQMKEAGVTHVVMEVSSGGLMMHRVDHVDFDVAIFLNLTKDHVGHREHPTFEHYRDAKAKLFHMADVAILNEDDPHGAYMADKAKGLVKTLSLRRQEADFTVAHVEEYGDMQKMGSTFMLTYEGISEKYQLPYPGRFNVYNAGMAIAVLLQMGFSGRNIAMQLHKVKVPGRFQLLEGMQDVVTILDYAHNEVALTSLLETVKNFHPRSMFIVIGSVGNRTYERREELARVAAAYCQVVIFTEDNQDREDPRKIAEEMAGYIKSQPLTVVVEPNRREAIKYAVSKAQPGDVIVLAGKGHEDYNLVHGEKVPYSDESAFYSVLEELHKRIPLGK